MRRKGGGRRDADARRGAITSEHPRSSCLKRLDAWDEHSADIHEMLDGGGEGVLGVVILIGRGKASGVGVDVRLYGHFKVRDGKVVYLYEYQDRAAALKALGLAE